MPNFLRKKEVSLLQKKKVCTAEKAVESQKKSPEESERLKKVLQGRPKKTHKVENIQTAAFSEKPSCSYIPDAQQNQANNALYNLNELYYMVSSKQNPKEIELVPIRKVCGYLYKLPITRKVQHEKREFTFNQLAAELQYLKLPNPNWKIITELKNKKFSNFTFTNFLKVGERSVTFNSDHLEYTIIIEDRPAELLGAPGKVENIRDVEILLEIVQTIDKNDIMIEYKNPV